MAPPAGRGGPGLPTHLTARPRSSRWPSSWACLQPMGSCLASQWHWLAVSQPLVVRNLLGPVLVLGDDCCSDTTGPLPAVCRRRSCRVDVPHEVATGWWWHGKAPQHVVLTAAQLLHRCRQCLLTTDCVLHAARLADAAVHCAPSCHVLPAPIASSALPPVKCAVMTVDAPAGALRPGDAVAGKHIPRVADLGTPAGASLQIHAPS